ncbi:MAG: hypothetical protein ABFS03_01735 [Chloroflexota bacterium]
MQRRLFIIFLSLILVAQGCSILPTAKIDDEILGAVEETQDVTMDIAEKSTSISDEATSAIHETKTPEVVTNPSIPSATPTADIVENDSYETAKTAAIGEIYIYKVQSGSPAAMPNWSHPGLGCNWLGLAGQIFDLNGVPKKDTVVEVGGLLNGKKVLGLSLTGVIDLYGPGSYEIKLADKALVSQKTVWVQVKDGNGKVLSPKIFINTYSNCDKNLILLNFVEVDPYTVEFLNFLPLIMH